MLFEVVGQQGLNAVEPGGERMPLLKVSLARLEGVPGLSLGNTAADAMLDSHSLNNII